MSGSGDSPPPRKLPRLKTQLDAYAERIVRNLATAGEITSHGAELQSQLDTARQELKTGELDTVGFFLALKAIEYRVVLALRFALRELEWFVWHDLRQTPATDADIDKLTKQFLAAPPGSDALDPSAGPKIAHVALTYWREYADAVTRAARRERRLSLLLAVGLGFTVLSSLLGGLLFAAEANGPGLRALAHWILSSPVFYSIGFGVLGALVSVALAGERSDTIRPLDDTYRFWSTVPRLLLGAIAGSLAPALQTLVNNAVKPEVLGREFMNGSLLTLLAFAAGFSDRLFFSRLISTTWKASGLSNAERAGQASTPGSGPPPDQGGG